MSYTRFDDEHDQYFITDFRVCLIDEVRALKGARSEFDIFQDDKSVKWGEKWRERIDAALDAATLLIAIMTPTFFQSPHCRHEVEIFLQREEDLGGKHLIMPIYYITAKVLENDALRMDDPIASKLHEHQRDDWRELRFTPLDKKPVLLRINSLAWSIVNELESDPPDRPPQVPGRDSGRAEAEAPEEAASLSLVHNAERPVDTAAKAPKRRPARRKKLPGGGSAEAPSGLAVQLGQVTFQGAEPTILAIRAAKTLRALGQHPAGQGDIAYVTAELERTLRSAVDDDATADDARSRYEQAERLRKLLISLVAE